MLYVSSGCLDADIEPSSVPGTRVSISRMPRLRGSLYSPPITAFSSYAHQSGSHRRINWSGASLSAFYSSVRKALVVAIVYVQLLLICAFLLDFNAHAYSCFTPASEQSHRWSCSHLFFSGCILDLNEPGPFRFDHKDVDVESTSGKECHNIGRKVMTRKSETVKTERSERIEQNHLFRPSLHAVVGRAAGPWAGW